MNPKQLTDHVERGCNSEGYLEMVNGLLILALGVVYISKNTVNETDPKLIVFLREETDRTGCGFLYDIELFVIVKQLSEVNQTRCLFPRITKSFENFRRLFRLLSSPCSLKSFKARVRSFLRST